MVAVVIGLLLEDIMEEGKVVVEMDVAVIMALVVEVEPLTYGLVVPV